MHSVTRRIIVGRRRADRVALLTRKGRSAVDVARSIWPWNACVHGSAVNDHQVIVLCEVAQGQALVRARMERFVRWLDKRGLPVSRGARCPSPEVAAVQAVDMGLMWPFYTTSESWGALAAEATLSERQLHVSDLLASPEWAARTFNASEVRSSEWALSRQGAPKTLKTQKDRR
jgi:hypothetical protein